MQPERPQLEPEFHWHPQKLRGFRCDPGGGLARVQVEEGGDGQIRQQMKCVICVTMSNICVTISLKSVISCK